MDTEHRILDLDPVDLWDEPDDVWLPPQGPVDDNGEGPGRRPVPAPDESQALSLVIFGSLTGLGVLKLAFFLANSAAAVTAVAVAFVVAHGLFIGLGASWFWPRRYRKG